MTHPTTAGNVSVPVSAWEAAQGRLHAAIALFRSEASASGYLVEEVRLRLPVQDVDMYPRVVIAQQNGQSNTPPIYPAVKQPRSGTGQSPSAPNRPPIPPASLAAQNGTKSPSHPAPIAQSPQTNGQHIGKIGAGFKRTVSGSVIVRQSTAAQPAHMPFSATNGSSAIPTSPVQKVGEVTIASQANSCETKQESKEEGSTDAAHSVPFWKTTIPADKNKAILKAAQSIQKMRKAVLDSDGKVAEATNDKTEMEITKAEEDGPDSDEQDGDSSGAMFKEEDADDKDYVPDYSAKSTDSEDGERTLRFNGQDIPESHVQLLLSSAATISDKDTEPNDRKDSSFDSSNEDSDFAEERKQLVRRPPSADSKIGSKNGLKATSSQRTSSGRRISRGRRDSSDRITSRSSPAARPFKCHKCPSSFDREGHLRVHILAVHEKKRPFVCQVCDASFGHSSSLLRHVRTVHQASPAIGSGRIGNSPRNGPTSTGVAKSDDVSDEPQDDDDNEKHFRCSACSQKFSRVALLNRHVANKHPVRTSSADEPEDSESADSA